MEHKSVDEPFPIHGDNDLPPEICHKEIKSHYDTTLLTGSESEELLGNSTVATDLEGTDPAPRTEALGHQREESNKQNTRHPDILHDQVLGGRPESMTESSTFHRPSKVVKPQKFPPEEIEPISSRTRSRKKVIHDKDSLYFLTVELPTQLHSGYKVPTPSIETQTRWSATPSL